jgi:hypothetical protein
MKRLSVLLITLAITALCLTAAAQIEVTSDSGSTPDFASGVSCGKCHRDIFEYWKDSLHAHALDDHIFQAAYMTAIKDVGEEARGICLSCHAPAAAVTGDLNTETAISREAVTCDFCHRITGVDVEGAAPSVTLTTGKDKHGPLEPSVTNKAHSSVQSDLFTDSKLCATCHQWSNAQGVAIFDTYNEWLKGPYAKKGEHCQSCHMPLIEGSVVKGKNKLNDGMVNSHNLSGGHSIVQVASAASVSITSVERVTGGIKAVVEIANVGSGHMIPTGIPSRSLLLEVQLVDSRGKVAETTTREFKKVIVDENHAELTRDVDIILKGAAVSKDNRIPPGGKVEIPVHFAASSREKYLVRAQLSYKYKPLILKEEDITIEMGSDVASP